MPAMPFSCPAGGAGACGGAIAGSVAGLPWGASGRGERAGKVARAAHLRLESEDARGALLAGGEPLSDAAVVLLLGGRDQLRHAVLDVHVTRQREVGDIEIQGTAVGDEPVDLRARGPQGSAMLTTGMAGVARRRRGPVHATGTLSRLKSAKTSEAGGSSPGIAGIACGNMPLTCALLGVAHAFLEGVQTFSMVTCSCNQMRRAEKGILGPKPSGVAEGFVQRCWARAAIALDALDALIAGGLEGGWTVRGSARTLLSPWRDTGF